MINVNLTNEQFSMLERIMRDGRDRESRLAYESQWPANGRHEANVRLIDTIEDAMRDAVAARIAEVRRMAEGMRQQANQ